MKKPWAELELQVFKCLREKGVIGRHLVVAVSGGLDSMALLACLSQLQDHLKLQLTVAHVHHGPGDDPRQASFRDRAADKVLRQAESLGLRCIRVKLGTGSAETAPPDEARLRALRYDALAKAKEQAGGDLLVLAHHRDDLMETRLIRLIRGVGPEGLGAMSVLNGDRLRPFLNHARDEIAAYAENRGLSWIEDPSNADTGPLRNWVRHEWLPQLEAKRPGASAALARSLESLAGGLDRKWVEEYFNARGILRARLLELGEREQRQVIASFLRHKGAQNYSLSHIEEVLKRLRTERRELSFRLMNRDWKINAEYIEII
ncbi:MAG TPA: tRNA lysidine(34) synthetase TilS [Bdellovibrionales bacterium]|nr:tRNA lysidine(34) synthetase TilS [Bdellovibrionales bacterium]